MVEILEFFQQETAFTPETIQILAAALMKRGKGSDSRAVHWPGLLIRVPCARWLPNASLKWPSVASKTVKP
jgi:hypothetical protein